MNREEFNAIMADSHDTMVDNRMDTAWGIISKLQAENGKLRKALETIIHDFESMPEYFGPSAGTYYSIARDAIKTQQQ